MPGRPEAPAQAQVSQGMTQEERVRSKTALGTQEETRKTKSYLEKSQKSQKGKTKVIYL